MRIGWFALGACAALAACAPAGYYDGYGYGGYSNPGYSYAAPGYGYPYGYSTGPAVVGVWEGGRGWDRDRFERGRFDRERERGFRGPNPTAPRVWSGGGRVAPAAPQVVERRPPPAPREAPRASNAPRVWP